MPTATSRIHRLPRRIASTAVGASPSCTSSSLALPCVHEPSLSESVPLDGRASWSRRTSPKPHADVCSRLSAATSLPDRSVTHAPTVTDRIGAARGETARGRRTQTRGGLCLALHGGRDEMTIQGHAGISFTFARCGNRCPGRHSRAPASEPSPLTCPRPVADGELEICLGIQRECPSSCGLSSCATLVARSTAEVRVRAVAVRHPSRGP